MLFSSLFAIWIWSNFTCGHALTLTYLILAVAGTSLCEAYFLHIFNKISSPQVFFTPAQSSAEKPLLPDTSTANNTDYETAVSLSEPETAVPCPPLWEQSLEERKEREEERQEAIKDGSVEERKKLVQERKAGYHTETTSESEVCGARSEGCHSNPEKTDRRARHTLSLQERGSFCGCHEPRSSHLRKPHAGTKLRTTEGITDLHAESLTRSSTARIITWLRKATQTRLMSGNPFHWISDLCEIPLWSGLLTHFQATAELCLMENI